MVVLLITGQTVYMLIMETQVSKLTAKCVYQELKVSYFSYKVSQRCCQKAVGFQGRDKISDVMPKGPFSNFGFKFAEFAIQQI